MFPSNPEQHDLNFHPKKQDSETTQRNTNAGTRGTWLRDIKSPDEQQLLVGP